MRSDACLCNAQAGIENDRSDTAQSGPDTELCILCSSIYAVFPDKILYSGQAMVFLHDCRPMLCYIISIFINRISAKPI